MEALLGMDASVNFHKCLSFTAVCVTSAACVVVAGNEPFISCFKFIYCFDGHSVLGIVTQSRATNLPSDMPRPFDQTTLSTKLCKSADPRRVG